MDANRLTALRAELARQGLDGFIVPRADEHLGEYVPESAERLSWLTGFTGSAGIATVLADRAAVFTDGRYVLQLAAQTDSSQWAQLHVTDRPPPKWVAEHAAKGAKIGYDPLLIAEEGLARYTDAGLTMVPASRNPIDAIWTDRPMPPTGPAVPHALAHAGRSSEDKRADIGKILRDAKQDAAVLTDPASVAWLLNIRGGDVPFTPFALGFALVHADGGTELFMDPVKLPEPTRGWLGNGVSVAGRDALAPALARLAGKMVRVDAAGSPVWFAQQLRAAGATVVAASDPCLIPKARKNATEQQGMRDAHARDAVAICRFLHWVDEHGTASTEMGAAEKLLALRQDVPLFRGESFPAISGAGEHGAIIHYRVTPETNRPIRPNEVYLIDSGGQYLDGTTDITRTVWTGPGAAPAEVKARVTAVIRVISPSPPPFFRRGCRARISIASPAARSGRWVWTTITAPATALAAIYRSTRGRSAFRASPARSRSRRGWCCPTNLVTTCPIITVFGWKTSCWSGTPKLPTPASRFCGLKP